MHSALAPSRPRLTPVAILLAAATALSCSTALAADSFEEFIRKDREAFKKFVEGRKPQDEARPVAIDADAAMDLVGFIPTRDGEVGSARKPDENQVKAVDAAMKSLGFARQSWGWLKGNCANGGTSFAIYTTVYDTRSVPDAVNPPADADSRYYNSESFPIEDAGSADVSPYVRIKSKKSSEGYGREWKYYWGTGVAESSLRFCKVEVKTRIVQGTPHYPVATPAKMTKEEEARIVPLVRQGITNAAKNCAAETKKFMTQVVKAYIDHNVCNCTNPPVIFIPGVAASELWDGPGKLANQLWPFAYLGQRPMLRFERNGLPSGARTNVTVGAILRRHNFITTNIPYVRDTNCYGPLIEYLESRGYKEKEDLITFPYDWRIDNKEHFASLDKKVNALRMATGRKKIVLVAHSMGGLIACGYVRSKPERAKKIDYIITLGTPFWGSPKVYYGLVAGYNFENDTIRQHMCKILFQNYPACYQLLPRVPFVMEKDSSNFIPVDRSLRDIRYKWYTNITWLGPFWDWYSETDGNDHRMNTDLIELADEFYKPMGTKMQAKPMPEDVELYTIMGCGIQTLGHYKVRKWEKSFLERWVLPDICTSSYLELGSEKVVLEPHFHDGDKTVPKYSLITDAATKKYFLEHQDDDSTEHGYIPVSKRALAIVEKILKGTPPDPSNYTCADTDERAELDSVDYTLRSDARMCVIDAKTEAILGYDYKDFVREDIPTGTFLDLDSSEYASIADTSREQIVHIKGIRTGSFTLIVDITRGDKVITFYYPHVPVQKGTSARIQLTPDAITDSFPEMIIKTGDEEQRIPAKTPTSPPPT